MMMAIEDYYFDGEQRQRTFRAPDRIDKPVPAPEGTLGKLWSKGFLNRLDQSHGKPFIDGIPHMFLVDKNGFLRFDNVRANDKYHPKMMTQTSFEDDWTLSSCWRKTEFRYESHAAYQPAGAAADWWIQFPHSRLAMIWRRGSAFVVNGRCLIRMLHGARSSPTQYVGLIVALNKILVIQPNSLHPAQTPQLVIQRLEDHWWLATGWVLLSIMATEFVISCLAIHYGKYVGKT